MNSFHFREGGVKPPRIYTLPICDFDLRTAHARTLLPAALASVSFGFVLVRVRVCYCHSECKFEAQTPRRKEVGTQEPEIPTVATLQQAT
jgi:hypothetical protein